MELKPNIVKTFFDVKQNDDFKDNIVGFDVLKCLFKLRSYSKKSNEWSLNILNGVHNHPIGSKLEGHHLAGILIEKDKKIVANLTRNMVEPKNILMNLKDKRKYTLTNIKQVYNAHQRFKKFVRDERSKMQHMLKCLKDHKYVDLNMFTSLEANVSLLLFQIHFGLMLNLLRCLNTFSNVFTMNFMYKTICTNIIV